MQNQWESWACFLASRWFPLGVVGGSGIHSPLLELLPQLYLRSSGRSLDSYKEHTTWIPHTLSSQKGSRSYKTLMPCQYWYDRWGSGGDVSHAEQVQTQVKLHLFTAVHLLCGHVPNRPCTTTGPCPGVWGPKWGRILGGAVGSEQGEFGNWFSLSFSHLNECFIKLLAISSLIFFKISMFHFVFFTHCFGASLVKTFPLTKLLVKTLQEGSSNIHCLPY